MLGGIGGRRKRGWQRMRWLDGITNLMEVSLTESGSWWWTWRPGVLWFMRSQRVRHDWATQLNWTELRDSKRHATWYADTWVHSPDLIMPGPGARQLEITPRAQTPRNYSIYLILNSSPSPALPFPWKPQWRLWPNTPWPTPIPTPASASWPTPGAAQMLCSEPHLLFLEKVWVTLNLFFNGINYSVTSVS